MEHNTAITKKEFKRMVTMHGKWLSGNLGRRANFFGDRFEPGVNMHGIDLTLSDFRNADLSGMDLSWANLSRADLTNANLTGANLVGAGLDYIRFANAELTDADLGSSSMFNSNLTFAHLIGANLVGANMNHSMMHGANLRNANLANANLRCTDLTNADLRDANLSYADLSHADLLGADLRGANLKGVDLSRSDIRGCRFDETENARFGEILKSPITGYKKSKEGLIVTLEIPKGAIVFSINNGKCRTNVAKVIDTEGNAELTSSYDPKFKYRAGEEIRAKDFCMAYNIECGQGIHFFKTRDEAVQYKML